MLYIHHASIFTPGQHLDAGAVLIENDRIVAMGQAAHSLCPPDAQMIDATGLILAPGFIDLQLNGAFGLDFTANPHTIFEVAARLPRYGITAFLPTIITSPLETVARAQAALLGGPPPGFRGATPLGLHLEGPFLNPAKRGAHNPNYLRLPELTAVAGWSPDQGVRLVTLAPELPQALEVISHLHERGVVVSAGHSMATLEAAQAGIDAGITYGTHLFNAMPGLEHRAPGLAGALLVDPRITVGVIPDGLHIHPALVKLTWQAKRGSLNVVTDAMAALGMPPGPALKTGHGRAGAKKNPPPGPALTPHSPQGGTGGQATGHPLPLTSEGRYMLGDLEVIVDETSARLSDGRLAGSILSLDQALRNLLNYTGCSLSEALATMTDVPARLLGLPDRGQIAPGFVADLVLLTPQLKVAKTIVSGEIVASESHIPPHAAVVQHG